MELLDLVDENNQLTGETAPRDVVHEKGLWHRVVHVYFYRVVDGEVELLTHLRSKEKKTSPNRWDARFGGHVVAGQTVEEAVVAEVYEEAGISIDFEDVIPGPVFTLGNNNNRTVKNEFQYAFYYYFDDDLNTLTLQEGEVEEVKWVRCKDIRTALEQEPDRWCGVNGFPTAADFLEEFVI